MRGNKRRTGAIAVAVLVCLLITATIGTRMLHCSLRARQETRWQRQLLQTQLLLEAGVQRAKARVQQDAEYQGEEWTPSGVFPGDQIANVKIEMLQTDDAPLPMCMVVARIANSGNADKGTQKSHLFSIGE